MVIELSSTDEVAGLKVPGTRIFDKDPTVESLPMLSELFARQRDYMDHFFKSLDLDAAEAFFQSLAKCTGSLFFCGVGKSGIIAQKIAATMASTGTKALAISPMDALHGDLGNVSKNDLFVLISKSGESDELLNLVPYVRNKCKEVLAIVSNPGSRLAKASDFCVNLPLKQELCPFGMAPTTSAAIQLIFGDVMAVALMKTKKFSLSAYSENHPSGRIGKRLNLKVEDLMLRGDEVPLVLPSQKLKDVLVILSNKRCGCLIVVDDQKRLLGIFTDGDLRRSLQSQQEKVLELEIEALMTESPKSIGVEQLAWSAAEEMESDPEHPVMVLPVVDGGTVVGLIKMHDIIQAGLA